ncbi:hypothetical protein HU200_059688 [Digitaria exilis]|uniref:Nodulation signaling pathway 2-like protein n=1 Tax=Digitaria exilis TaxID=1010633 RepID=A0A835ADT4_9POAL|nr:hypothetical protein HU200_059688 [Digitaria exilis]
METMSYPCSPLIPFPTQHEESSYLLWSPQLVIPLENGNMCDADAGPSPDQQQQEDHELMDMMIQEANGLLLQDDLSSGDPFLACFDQGLATQENARLLTIQEEFMEEKSSLSDLLIAGVRAVEAQDSTSASAILSRLDGLIHGVPYRSSHHAAVSSSSDHLAYYFARGLRSRISGELTECHPAAAPPAPASRTPAYRMLQELSPFIKFAHFTANQAILEATSDDPCVHVVDLNVGEGVQWAPLMSDLARHGGKTFHLTAADDAGSDAAGAHQTTAAERWLSEFAESLGLPFQYSSLRLSSEDLHGFTASCNGGGSVIVSCDTTEKSYRSLIRLQRQLLGTVKILQPKLVILIEDELFRIDRNLAPFAEFCGELWQHFAAMLESLERCLCDGGYGAWLGLVEKETLGPSIEDAVGQYEPLTGGPCAELEGLRACEISCFNVAQGKMLAGLFSRGFGVVHEEGRLALCWNSRPLTSVSVWSPVSV